MKKCKECEYGESKLPIIFYGETAPRKCPLRNGGQK